MFSPDDSTFSKNSVIRPPKEDIAKRKYRCVIDSRDRNITTFPLPSKYDITLPQHINNVTEMRLVIADIPFSRYLVHANNNLLFISEDAPVQVDGKDTFPQEVCIALDQGDHDGASLAQNVQDKLNAAYNGTYVVEYNAVKDKYTFTNTGGNPFYFLFQGPVVPYGPQSYDKHSNQVFGESTGTYRPNSVGRLLGFDNKNFASTNGVIVAPFRKNFIKDRYISMRIERAEHTYGTSASIDRCFCIVDSKQNDLNNDYKSDTIKVFDPPLNSLQKLQISFRDYYGNLYDFQNINHRIELEFIAQPFA
jgi:hypothetical protein